MTHLIQNLTLNIDYFIYAQPIAKGDFSTIITYISAALSVFFALLPQIFKIGKCCPFRISWWAISFPLAAMCIASFSITESIALKFSALSSGAIFFSLLSSMLLITVTLAFVWLLMRTLKGIIKGELKNLA